MEADYQSYKSSFNTLYLCDVNKLLNLSMPKFLHLQKAHITGTQLLQLL